MSTEIVLIDAREALTSNGNNVVQKNKQETPPIDGGDDDDASTSTNDNLLWKILNLPEPVVGNIVDYLSASDVLNLELAIPLSEFNFNFKDMYSYWLKVRLSIPKVRHDVYCTKKLIWNDEDNTLKLTADDFVEARAFMAKYKHHIQLVDVFYDNKPIGTFDDICVQFKRLRELRVISHLKSYMHTWSDLAPITTTTTKFSNLKHLTCDLSDFIVFSKHLITPSLSKLTLVCSDLLLEEANFYKSSQFSDYFKDKNIKLLTFKLQIKGMSREFEPQALPKLKTIPEIVVVCPGRRQPSNQDWQLSDAYALCGFINSANTEHLYLSSADWHGFQKSIRPLNNLKRLHLSLDFVSDVRIVPPLPVNHGLKSLVHLEVTTTYNGNTFDLSSPLLNLKSLLVDAQHVRVDSIATFAPNVELLVLKQDTPFVSKIADDLKGLSTWKYLYVWNKNFGVLVDYDATSTYTLGDIYPHHCEDVKISLKTTAATAADESDGEPAAKRIRLQQLRRYVSTKLVPWTRHQLMQKFKSLYSDDPWLLRSLRNRVPQL